MIRIIGIRQRLVAARQEIQVIYIISMPGHHRMISFRDHHNVVITCHGDLIERAVIIVNLLYGISLGLSIL